MSSSSRFAFAPRSLLAVLLLPLFVSAQTATDLNEGLSLQTVPETPGAFQVNFWGGSGRTYFLQRSTDLTAPWEYFPVIETGQNAPISYGFTSEAPRIFVRLRIVDETYSDAYSLDTDGDGLTNQQEFAQNSDPFSVHSDADGLSDYEEAQRGSDPRLADTDGDDVFDEDDGWPRQTWITQAPLPDVSYAVIALRGIGLPANVTAIQMDDQSNILGTISGQSGLVLWHSEQRQAVTPPMQLSSTVFAERPASNPY